MSYAHPFESGIRVMLVKLAPGERGMNGAGDFAVALHGARHVIPLPLGYDGRTSVFWVSGWVIVQHADHPALLADFTTEKLSPMNEQAMAAAMAAFEAPRLHAP